MKNKTLTLITFLLIIGTVACTNNQANTLKQTEAQFAPLKERNSELAKLPDWETVKSKATEFFSNIKKDSLDIKSKLLLAQLYMQEARITGEHPYYYPATLIILDDVIKHDPENFEAYAFKASVLLSLHHFKEALDIGMKAVKLNSYNGFIYGVLCDANVELGNYEEAVKMSDKMQSLRPGLESYSRASYLREIYGDNAGAIDAMKMAYQAGLPSSEESSWAGNTLTNLYINTGDLKNAENISENILQQRPSYAFATAALGRIEMAKGNYDNAIVKFDEAIKVMPEVSFYENKAEAYKAKGDIAKANEIYNTCLAMLSEDAESGHYVDMELAKIYLELSDNENALKFARIEYERRPLNIDAGHTLAWVYYKKGNFEEAKKLLKICLRMGTQNAELLEHAGAIEMAIGDTKTANEYFAKSKKINPKLPNTFTNKS